MSRFVRLCETASPTGEERAVADLVRAELEGFGLEVTEDDAAGPAGAAAGNLLTRIPGESGDYILFCAHLDTVPHRGPVQVSLDRDGIYRSAGDTILGADNKAAVAVLIELAARYSKTVPPVGFELLFTVAEEQGLRGAAAFDLTALRSGIGFVFDHATDIGEVITAAPTHLRIRGEFRGVEAHAGIRPEAGRSAIEAAAAAITAMELGRLDPESTANIGTIGGGSSDNVIPGSCSLTGEARSVDGDRAATVIAAMGEQMVWAASEADCELDVVTEKVFSGYRIEPVSAALAIAEAALRGRGHEPQRVTTGGGSDVNVLIAGGLDCLLLANGTYANHTSDEWVPRRNLVEMLEICEGLLTESATRG